MANSNGSAAKLVQKVTNGQATNGHATNGHAVTSSSKVTMSSKSAKSTSTKKSFNLFSVLSRILTWYSIITIFFRCPATNDLVSDSSPQICKPYFQLRSTITPHLEPYYNTYAAPYVDAARPYYNAVDKIIIAPATSLGAKYGAPRVAKAQAFGQAQWNKNVQPQVSKYKNIAKAQYDQTFAPHFNKATSAVAPYYDITKTNALQTYYGHILPTYKTIQPYAIQGYTITSDLVVSTVVPYSQWVWATGGVFLDRTVFPKLRILYGENVEPQLVRIGERLGRYRDGKKLKAAVDSVDSSSTSASASSTYSSLSSSIASAYETPVPSSSTSIVEETTDPVVAEEAAQPTPLTSAEVRANAQKIVADDLKTWQEKFAKAADVGSEELESRITEITDRMTQSQARKVGRALNIQLEETVKSSLSTLKSKIISIVKDSSTDEDKEEALSIAVRKAGVAIKEKAQNIRTWRLSFNKELALLISEAGEETFQIIDHIRDLGLQEVGMRWAWIDGVTHKDWAKYHQLKNKFDEWRLDVEEVSNQHPGITKARAAAEEVESQAMDTSEVAAKKLARMKEIGRWKIATNDASDDFSTKIMPAVAANAAQKIMEKVSGASEAVAGTSQGTMESISSVASSSGANIISSAQSVTSSISSSIIGTPQGSAKSVISAGSASLSSVADQASSSIIGTKQGSAESIVSAVKESASSLANQASSSVIGTSQGSGESIASSLSKIVKSSISSGTSKIGSASSLVASSVSEIASKATSTVSKNVWGGAEAQFVEARQIVFDDVILDSDEDTYSEKIQSMASLAGDKFADITNAVSAAILEPTKTGGNVATVTILAAEKYSSALSAASVALYGTAQGTGERISSVVSGRYADAIAAASSVIYGTPTPVAQSIAAQASEAYNNALSQAALQYEQARSIISQQVSGTPKPIHEEMYSSVENAYSHASVAANSRLQAALSSASTAVYGTPTGTIESLFGAVTSALYATATPTGALQSISSVASAKLAEGLSAANAQYEDAKSYLSAVQTGDASKQKLSSQMQVQYYAAVGMAHARFSDFVQAASGAIISTQTPTPAYQAALSSASASYASVVSAASVAYESAASVVAEQAALGASGVSSAVVGSDKPWTESVASAASANWEALITKASTQVYGQPTPYFVTRRLLSEAKEFAESATDAVAAQYTAVASLISELVAGKEPDFTESVYSRFSSAYYIGAGEAVSSASSYASEAYASASSVAASVLTQPPSIETVLDTASSKVSEVVEAVSSNVEELASSVSSVVSSGAAYVQKDEL